MCEVLTVEEMYQADQVSIERGISGSTLMENAGAGVADLVKAKFKPKSCLVLCGPGNNGGDGFVIARHLKNAGVQTKVALFGEKKKLAGDAQLMAGKWRGKIHPLSPDLIDKDILIIDAVFGAGLGRPVTGLVADALTKVAQLGNPVVAVDVPSGVDGNSGNIRGVASKAAMTVTFFRPKPGHLLFPGRQYCGELRVIDIGIPADVLTEIEPSIHENHPDLWLADFPWPVWDTHKYQRGHAVILSGPRAKTGAARLAARAALRIGGGLVTVASPANAVNENATQLTAVMIEAFKNNAEFFDIIKDRRRNALLLGPGAGVGRSTRSFVEKALKLKKSVVLDADALTVFANNPNRLFERIKCPCIMTPHEGEFSRLFDIEGDKLKRAKLASAKANAVIILKGADTVIAAPDGRTAINTSAPAWLATAGSGDVLAGFCTGLLAQQMPAFEAACAAVWIHGASANAFGPGLIAEDISEAVPLVLSQLALMS